MYSDSDFGSDCSSGYDAPTTTKKIVGIYEHEIETNNGFGAFLNFNPFISSVTFVKAYANSLIENIPFLYKLVSAQPENILLLLFWVIAQLAQAFIPALGLYYTGELLNLAERAIDQKRMDKSEFWLL